MASEEDDAAAIAALDRVLTRLALVEEDDKLESVLHKLLPRLLLRLAERDAVRNKALEVLQHIGARLRERARIQLPCLDLVELVNVNEQHPLVANSALAYLETGASRLSPGEKSRLLPIMVRGISHLNEKQQAVVFRIIMSLLPAASISGDTSQWFLDGTSDDDKELFLSFLLDIMFFVPARPGTGAATVPPGLTPSRLERLKNKDGNLPTAAELADLQLAVLRLCLSRVFTIERTLCHLILGRHALRHDVVSMAEQGMNRVMQQVNLQDEELLLNLMSFAAPSLSGRKGATSAVRERTLGVLLKAGRGLEALTSSCITVVEDCLISSASTLQVRVFALEFLQEMLRNISLESFMENDGDSKLELIMRKQLEQIKRYSEKDTVREREATYSTLAALASRFPSIYNNAIVLVSDLLESLEKDRDARISVQEALSSLARSFLPSSGASKNARLTVKELVLPLAESDEPKARLVAADWCTQLFPFEDCDARFICLRLVCDPDLATRHAAVRGLMPEFCGENATDQGKISKESKRKIRRLQKWTSDALETLSDASKIDTASLPQAWTDKENFPEEYMILKRDGKRDFFPSFWSWIRRLVDNSVMDRIVSSSDRSMQLQFASLLGFSSVCLEFDPNVTVDREDLDRFRFFIEAALQLEDKTRTRALHRVASKSLVRLIETRPEMASMLEPSWLLAWLASESAVVRDNIADLVQYAESAKEKETFVNELIFRSQKKVMSATAARHGAILALGRLLCASPNASISSALFIILKGSSQARIIGMACITAMGLAAESGHLDLNEDELLEFVSKVVEMLKAMESMDSIAEGLYALARVGLNGPQAVREAVCENLLQMGEMKSTDVQLANAKALSILVNGDADFFDILAERIVKESFESTKNAIKTASTYWMLRLIVDHEGESHLQPHLESFLTAFAMLIRDRAELTREAAARGMAWCFYAASNPAVKSEVVASLARHMAAKSDYKEARSDEKDWEDFGSENGDTLDGRGENGTGNDLDGDVRMRGMKMTSPLHAAYKEMYQVAVRVRQPSLTYRLLYLSVGDPLWKMAQTRDLRCPAFDLDVMLEEEKEDKHDLSAETVEMLIPILYHFRFDKELAIKSAMTKLWETITFDMGSDGEILQAHLKEIVEEVLRNVSSRKFRERFAGAVALTNIIRESPDEDLLGFLEDIWNLSLRLLDDLNEASKPAALNLAKTVNNLTVRLCTVESHSGNKKSKKKMDAAREALQIALPFLLEKGLSHTQSKEAQAVSIHTLARIVKVCGENIRPNIPTVISRLLESMSALEDPVLQYAMFHTTDRGGDLVQASQQELESMRVQASNESPMQQAIEICIDQIEPSDSLEDICPELARLARSGVGLPTLAATSRAISRLCSRRDLREGVKSHAPALLRGLGSQLNDRSGFIRRSFSAAAADVARLADEKTVRDYVKLIVNFYDDPGDAKSRFTSGNALRELLSKSSDSFSANKDLLLPMMLLARHDDDEDIEGLWKELWSENVGTIANGVSSNLEAVVPHVLNALSATTWLRKRQAAHAIRDIVLAVDSLALETCGQQLLEEVASTLPGRVWGGKEALLRTLADIWRKIHSFPSCPEEFRDPVVFCSRILLPEASRKGEGVPDIYIKVAYDAIAIVCLEGKPNSSELLEQLMNMAESLGSNAEVAAKAFEAIGAAWNESLSSAQIERLSSLTKKTLTGSSYVVAIGVMRCLKLVFPLIDAEDPSTRALFNEAWRCIVENKNTSAIIAALAALNALFSNQSRASEGLHSMASSSQTRLQPLLGHRDAAVVHAATSLQNSLSNF